MLDFASRACTVAAFGTVVGFPFCTFRTDCVIASHVRCRIRTAILAQCTVIAYPDTVFTLAARIARHRTVRAVFTAVPADIVCAVAAVIAVAAHTVCAVHTDSAFGTEFIHTSGALAAIFADVFCTVGADRAAVLTNYHTVTTLIARLAEDVACTFTADIAGCAKIVAAAGAFFIAVRAEICAVFTALSTEADYSAVGTQSADDAEAIRSDTVNARTAFGAHFSFRAV